jgi:hypothetical protein
MTPLAPARMIMFVGSAVKILSMPVIRIKPTRIIPVRVNRTIFAETGLEFVRAFR